MATEEDPKTIYITQTDETGANFGEVYISGSNLILQTSSDGILTGSTSLPNSSSVDALLVNNLIGNNATFNKIVSTQITGSFNGPLSGIALSSSYVDWNDIDNKPNLGEVQKVYYVSEDGLDTNDGKTLSEPFRTINKALLTVAVDQALNVADETFIITNSGFNYLINGYSGSFPTLTLVRGQVYNFDVSGLIGHPFALRLSDGNTSSVPGTTNNDPVNGNTGTATLITYSVPFDAPNSIIYQCTSHAYMIGIINIVNPQAYRSSVQIKSGYYVETGSMIVPPFTSIIGDDLRSVVVRPTVNTKLDNLFLMNNATYVYGLRLEGCEIDDLDDPRTGFFFAFAPSASISTSPYVQNCSAIHAPQTKSFAPLEPDASPIPNPLVGVGPGGMIIDDSVLNVHSPLKSMVVDAYTQVAFNGIGICVRGRGYAQLVSFFTNFSRVGVYCIDGGQASLLNSNTTFGDFGLYAKGKRYLVVPNIVGVSASISTPDSTLIADNKIQIVNDLIDYLIINGNKDYSDPTLPVVLSIRKDAGDLIDALSNDLLSAKASRTSRFTQGLFKGQDTSVGNIFTVTGNNAVAIFPVDDSDLLNDFLLSFDFIKDEINALGGFSSSAKITQLIDVVKNTLTSVVTNEENTFVQEFGSLITSTSHDFSYAGSGVNFLGLPNNQGGVGVTNFDTKIFQEDGGRVFQTSGDESGDFFAGSDFKINQAEGIIEGRAFARSLFALVTPFTLALENI